MNWYNKLFSNLHLDFCLAGDIDENSFFLIEIVFVLGVLKSDEIINGDSGMLSI